MDKVTAMKKYVNEFVDTVKKLRQSATPEEIMLALTYAEPKHIALFMPLFADCDLPPELNNAIFKNCWDDNKVQMTTEWEKLLITWLVEMSKKKSIAVWPKAIRRSYDLPS